MPSVTRYEYQHEHGHRSLSTFFFSKIMSKKTRGVKFELYTQTQDRTVNLASSNALKSQPQPLKKADCQLRADSWSISRILSFIRRIISRIISSLMARTKKSDHKKNGPSRSISISIKYLVYRITMRNLPKKPSPSYVSTFLGRKISSCYFDFRSR